MSPVRVPADAIRFHPMSFSDHNGRLFSWNQQLYRAMTAEGAERCKGLFERQAVGRLVDKGLLVGTEKTDLSLDGYGLVLRHQQVPFVSYPFEWSFSMLKDAALLVADLELELLQEGLTNGDCNPWNVLFDGPRPVYVDFSSVLSNPHDGSKWEGLEEFTCTFTHPLHLMAMGHDHIARWLLHDRDRGVSHEDFDACTGRSARRAAATRAIRSVRSRIGSIVGRTRLLPEIRKLVGNSNGHLGNSKRSGLIRQVRRQIEQIEPPKQASAVADPVDAARRQAFQSALDQVRPGSVLHIARDEAWLSKLAAGVASITLVLERTASAAERLYLLAKAESTRLLPLVMDFRYPSAGAGLGQREMSSATERLRCDLVVAAGILPELVFERGLGFEQICEAIASFAAKQALIEFSPVRVSMPAHRYADERWRAQFAWYTLENLTAGLRAHFRRVECAAKFGPSTVVLSCEK